MPRNDEPPRSGKKRNSDDDTPPPTRSKNLDDDDDRPRKKRDREEDDERPRSRNSREDEEDDSPRKGRDEDEDERPRSRKNRNEDDDRPSKRRQDDDEDMKPSRGKKRPAKKRVGRKKGNGLLIGLLAGLAFLLIVGVGAVIYLIDPFGISGGAPKEMVSLMPAETTSIDFIDVNAIRMHEEPYRYLKKDFVRMERSGIPLENVDAIMLGRDSQFDGSPTTTVIRLSKPVDRDAVIRSASAKESPGGEKKYYRTATGMGLYFASDRLVVATVNADTMSRILNKSSKGLEPNLQAALKRTKGDSWTAMGHTGGYTFGSDIQQGQHLNFSLHLPTARSHVISAKYNGSQVEYEGEITFLDSESARRAARFYEAYMKQQFSAMTIGNDVKSQELGRMYKSASVIDSGNRVTIRLNGRAVKGMNPRDVKPQ